MSKILSLGLATLAVVLVSKTASAHGGYCPPDSYEDCDYRGGWDRPHHPGHYPDRYPPSYPHPYPREGGWGPGRGYPGHYPPPHGPWGRPGRRW